MSRRIVPFLAVVLMAAPFGGGLVTACSDPAAHPAPAGEGSAKPPPPVSGGGDASATDSGSNVDGGDAGACNDLVTTGSVVDRIGVIGDLPGSNGGTIVNGSYDLSVYSVYGTGSAGPTGITAKSSLRISGGRIDQILELGGAGKTTSTSRTNASYAVTAASFSSTELCPIAGRSLARQFTATDGSLILTDTTTKEAFTFVKR